MCASCVCQLHPARLRLNVRPFGSAILILSAPALSARSQLECRPCSSGIPHTHITRTRTHTPPTTTTPHTITHIATHRSPHHITCPFPSSPSLPSLTESAPCSTASCSPGAGSVTSPSSPPRSRSPTCASASPSAPVATFPGTRTCGGRRCWLPKTRAHRFCRLGCQPLSPLGGWGGG